MTSGLIMVAALVADPSPSPAEAEPDPPPPRRSDRPIWRIAGGLLVSLLGSALLGAVVAGAIFVAEQRLEDSRVDRETAISNMLFVRTVVLDPEVPSKPFEGLLLEKAHLSFAELGCANLRSANLTKADLSSADLQGANLAGANLSDANLREADLSGAVLIGATLDDAVLDGANLTEADFADASLHDASMHGATLDGAFFARAAYRPDGLGKAYTQQCDDPVDQRADIERIQDDAATGLPTVNLDCADWNDATTWPASFDVPELSPCSIPASPDL